MVIPPVIGLIEEGAGGTYRRTYTFNAVERQGRNHDQIEVSLPFMSRMIDEAADGTVLIGHWIHVAQATMIAVDRPESEVTVVWPFPGLRAVQIEEGGRRILLVEEYDRETVRRIIDRLRAEELGQVFLTLLGDGEDVNETGWTIPRQLYWWSA